MSRPVRVEFAKDQGKKAERHNASIYKPGGAAGGEAKPLSEKSEGCTTVFMGNLSYDVTEAGLKEFFSDCKFHGMEGAGIVDIRWLTSQDTGEFRGCAFVQFDDTRDVDEAVKKNGKPLLGRSVRLDYG